MKTVQHKFVEFIPDHLDDGVLYISMTYGTAIHKCVCGCGNEVVTPFSPTDWKLTFDGRSVSLKPSIGNWNFECRSHYWIIQNKIVKCERWTEKQIDIGRKADKETKAKFYSEKKEKSRGSKKWDFKTFLKSLF
jgi:hypothetical protein